MFSVIDLTLSDADLTFARTSHVERYEQTHRLNGTLAPSEGTSHPIRRLLSGRRDLG